MRCRFRSNRPAPGCAASGTAGAGDNAPLRNSDATPRTSPPACHPRTSLVVNRNESVAGHERYFVLARQKGAHALRHLAAIFRLLCPRTTGAHMSKSIRGAILPIVAGIVALAAAAILVIVFMVHPETKVAPPSQAMQPRAEDRQAGGLSPEAMASLRDIIQAQGLNCPAVTDGTLQGEDRYGQVIRVSCDNELKFKVTMGARGGTYHIAPWE